VDGLNQLPGVKCARPRGAFYVFPNITGTGRSSAEVAERLLNEAGVAALSGAAFGAHGEGYLRVSYAHSEAHLKKALVRMRRVFESFARKCPVAPPSPTSSSTASDAPARRTWSVWRGAETISPFSPRRA